MAWHYFLGGATKGPIELAELQQLHQQGVVRDETPVWTEGMADWTAYQSTSAASAVTTLSGTPSTKKVCAECGRFFPEEEMLQYEGSWVCAACKPLFFQRLKEGVTQPGTLPYASIGRRFLAVFIDGILIDLVVFTPIILFAGFAGLTARGRETLSPGLSIALLLFEYLVPALYEILMIGRFGATLGKMVMKIKVVAPDGTPISYGRSTGRYFAKMLSAIILMIGYLMAFWDDEKRALHDRICNTRVVSNSGL